MPVLPPYTSLDGILEEVTQLCVNQKLTHDPKRCKDQMGPLKRAHPPQEFADSDSEPLDEGGNPPDETTNMSIEDASTNNSPVEDAITTLQEFVVHPNRKTKLGESVLTVSTVIILLGV